LTQQPSQAHSSHLESSAQVNCASWNHSRHVFLWHTLLHAGIRLETGGGEMGSGGDHGNGGALGDAGGKGRGDGEDGPGGTCGGGGSGDGGGLGGGGGESALQQPSHSQPSLVRLLHVISTPRCAAFCQKRQERPLQSLPHAGSAGGEAGGGETAGGSCGGVSTRAGQQPSHSQCSEFCSKSHVTPSDRNELHGLPLHCERHCGSDGGGGAAGAAVWFDATPSMPKSQGFYERGCALQKRGLLLAERADASE
jgi:hypothetical protein